MRKAKAKWIGNTENLRMTIKVLGFEILSENECVDSQQMRFRLAGGITVTWYKTTGTVLAQGKEHACFYTAWRASASERG